MKSVRRVGVRCGMQWDQKDEIDCTVAGRGDVESTPPISGSVADDRCFVGFALLKFATNQNLY